jgi:hypothetical protein
MRKHQRGVTMIGWLFLLTPLAICVYAGIRIGPMYLNYMNVVHNITLVASEVDNASATVDGIRTAIGKHFQVDYIEFPDVKDMKITRDNGNWTIEANYDDQAPLFSNIFILITFDKVVKLKGSDAG